MTITVCKRYAVSRRLTVYWALSSAFWFVPFPGYFISTVNPFILLFVSFSYKERTTATHWVRVLIWLRIKNAYRQWTRRSPPSLSHPIPQGPNRRCTGGAPLALGKWEKWRRGEKKKKIRRIVTGRQTNNIACVAMNSW